MNSHDLEAFAAVVETGSIVGASKRLHLTQPGISRRVQSLEEALGTTLLDRQSKPLRATVDGRRAYEMARRVLTSIAELRSTVGSETDFVGELRLGVSPFLADQALAAPFEELHRSFPRLSIRVTSTWSAELRPGTILDRFSRSALRPSDTHCSTLIGFIGMVRGSNPSLASTAVFVSGGGTTVT